MRFIGKNISGIPIIGDLASTSREGVVSFYLKNNPSSLIVEKLRQRKIRVHIRKDDHYCGNILGPLNQKTVSDFQYAIIIQRQK